MIPPHCLFRIITFIDGAGDIRAPIHWRRGASVRQYIGAPMSPAPIGNAHQAQWANNIFFVFDLPLLLAEYKEDDCVRCASPIFIPIAYYLSFGNRKRKYVAENTTGPSKSKQTSIATVRYPFLSLARLPTPLIFRYPLPLKRHSQHTPREGTKLF
jgi:hypothetical protein